MRNFLEKCVRTEVTLVLPEGWSADPPTARLELLPNARATKRVKLTIPADYTFPYPRVAITADVTFDGRRLG